MKKLIASSVAAATVLFGTSAFASDTSADDMQRQIQELQQQLRQQQEQLEALQGSAGQQFLTRDEATRLIQNEIALQVEEQVASEVAQMRDSSPILTLGKNIDGLDIRGDLRLRYERQEMEFQNGSESSLDRWRVRLRLGGVWRSEGWEVGLGLITGGTSSSSGTSGNDTYNESGVFETNSFDLDYAYAKHTWGDLSVTAGQFQNPFVGSWIMWDGDVRTTGVVGQYTYQDFFLTAGGFSVRHLGTNEAEAYLLAIQAGYDGSYDQLDFLVATSLYYFTKATVDTNKGTSPSPNTNSSVDGYDIQIWDLYGELEYNMNEVVLGAHGHVLYNFGAENGGTLLGATAPTGYNAEDNNLAWLAGGSVGYMGVTVGYDYAHIEGDSSYVNVNDSDFGIPVGVTSNDVKGHLVTVKYKVNDNLSFSGKAFFVETIERNSTNGNTFDEGQLYQVDAVWTF